MWQRKKPAWKLKLPKLKINSETSPRKHIAGSTDPPRSKGSWGISSFWKMSYTFSQHKNCVPAKAASPWNLGPGKNSLGFQRTSSVDTIAALCLQYPQEAYRVLERHSPMWKSRYWWQDFFFCALPRSCQPMAPFSGKTQLKASQLLSVPYPVFHKHLTVCRCTSLSRSHRVGPRPMCVRLLLQRSGLFSRIVQQQ